MEGVTNRFVATNGIKMHFVEMGSGPLVLLLHGFPETSYTWRHQIPILAKAGFHAVAPDLRGYGKTEVPVGVENYTGFHIVGDLIGLLDALEAPQAFVVGHDWGAAIAWHLCLFRPDRVLAHVSLSVPFSPRSPAGSIMQQMRSALGEGQYMCKFQELEKPEADIARVSPWRYLRNSFIYTSLPVENHSFEYESLLTSYDQFPLPPWISEQDIKYYETDFATSGFTGPLNYYRALDRTWELMAPWTKGKVIVPTLYMVGDGDVVYNGFPGAKDYIHKGMKTDVPNLKGVIVLEGLHHFLHEEKSEVVTEYILKFLKSFLP